MKIFIYGNKCFLPKNPIFAKFSIGNLVEVSFPIENDDEAISYAVSIEIFTEFRENATTFGREWKVRVLHITIESERQLTEYFIKKDPKNVDFYIKQLEETEARGEYWDLWWKKGDLLCRILFRSDGTILDFSEIFYGFQSIKYKYVCSRGSNY